VSNPQISFREIADVIKRRKLFVILPPLITTIVCTIGAFLVPRMYESSIRILVQSSEVKNPLTTLVNAMSERSEDPLNTFDEIIFSQKSIWQLMDSLGIETRSRSEAEKRSLFVKIHDNIQTKVQPHESFTITFYSNNPVQAQRGATILAEIFIQTVAALKNQKNQLTVEFYQKKLDEFQQQLERSQRQIVSTMRSRAQSSPNGNMYLYTRLDQLEQQIRDVESKKKENEQNLNVTRLSPEGILDKSGRQALFELQRSEAPYSTDLLTLLTNYEEKLEKYTPRHPEVTKVGSQIMDLLGRIGLALQSIINKQSVQLSNNGSDNEFIDRTGAGPG
jgi:succinoglycan biosynthesis transport protein ExoP